MPVTDNALLLDTTEKHDRVREAIRHNIAVLTLDQLQVDVEGSAPCFGKLLSRRLTANARKGRVKLGRYKVYGKKP